MTQFTCERFVGHFLGLDPASPQLKAFATVGAVGVLLYLLVAALDEAA